jgi:hypothetical protein
MEKSFYTMRKQACCLYNWGWKVLRLHYILLDTKRLGKNMDLKKTKLKREQLARN